MLHPNSMAVCKCKDSVLGSRWRLPTAAATPAREAVLLSIPNGSPQAKSFAASYHSIVT
jgi:hypothetical protein